MERSADDVNVKNLSADEINEMEERRIARLAEANIDETEVLEKCRENLNGWNSYFGENITRGKDDLNFCIRDQWTAVERSEFTRLFKPAMTSNKLYDATKKIVGEQRSNKPDLTVRSLTGKASQEEINLRADLVRTISYHSQTDLVYQTAFKSALLMGYGAFQVLLDYKSPLSFDKVIRYEIIPDVTMCAWDPTALKPHKGDGNFCSRRFIFTRDEFFATYPYVLNPVSFTDATMLLDIRMQTKDCIVVCDQFVKEWYPLKIFKLSNGQVVTEEEWKALKKSYEQKKEIVAEAIVGGIIQREMPHIVGERQTQDYKIMHYRLIQDQIIDFSEWPSKQLPIPFVDGDSGYIEGRQYTKSFIHEARDAQKLLNYNMSELATELKNRRREQWIGTPDNILGNEQQWRNPELQMGILIAKPDPKTGMMPTRMPPSEVPQALFMSRQACNQDIREILGFSESEQLQGRDISGKARRERKTEGSMSARVFFDNLNQAIEQGGKIVNDLLPYIYGQEEHHVQISKRDGSTESIVLNQKIMNGENVSYKNQILPGEFDVEINAGPSFAVQKEIALEMFQQTLAANPQSFNLIADLWAKNLDIQYMPQIVERFKNLVPPQILAKEAGKELPPQPPSPQEQMMQMEMEAKKAEIENKAKDIALKAQKLELEKAQLMLDAQKAQAENQLNIYDHQLNLKKAEVTHHADKHKSNLDFTHKIAALLTDIHKQEQEHKHAHNMTKYEDARD